MLGSAGVASRQAIKRRRVSAASRPGAPSAPGRAGLPRRPDIRPGSGGRSAANGRSGRRAARRQPDFREHVLRGEVGRMGDCDDRIEAQSAKAVIEHGTGRLGRDPLAPGAGHVAIADLDQPGVRRAGTGRTSRENPARPATRPPRSRRSRAIRQRCARAAARAVLRDRAGWLSMKRCTAGSRSMATQASRSAMVRGRRRRRSVVRTACGMALSRLHRPGGRE